jgi:DeoR/GlpR family transcriptional regulator of sugar metabolism
MIESERKREIMKALSAEGIINLHDIARRLDVSDITIRRDFEKMENEGKLKRVKGGASIEDDLSAELTMSKKLPVHMAEKEQIAAYAEKMVSDGDCIFVDAGTTAIPLVKRLINKDIRIITYNTLILNCMSARGAKAKLFLIGGEFLPYYDINIGSMSQETLKQFYFDIAFIGCSGIDCENRIVYTTESESLQMKKIAVREAGKKVLLADNTKLVSRGFLKVDRTDVFDKIIINKFETKAEYPENFIFV